MPEGLTDERHPPCVKCCLVGLGAVGLKDAILESESSWQEEKWTEQKKERELNRSGFVALLLLQQCWSGVVVPLTIPKIQNCC